jgi:transcriptional regulator with PAS, ATPase and Fis domain
MTYRDSDSASGSGIGSATDDVDEEDPSLGDTVPGDLRGGSLAGSSHAVLLACRDVARIADAQRLFQEVPRLVLSACPARGARLLEIGVEDAATVVAAAGLPFLDAAEPAPHWHPQLASPHEVCLRACRASSGGVTDRNLAAVAIPGGDGSQLVLELERSQGTHFLPHEMGELEIFACVASAVLSRARSHAALQSSAELGSAVMSAVRDAFIALDHNGVILALSVPAAALIGRRSKDAVGQRLADLPGMGPLVVALAAGERGPETVKLAGGDVSLRLRRYAGGMAVTLGPVKGQAAGVPRPARARFQLDDLIGSSPAMVRVREIVSVVADSQLPILVTGETGTGKEILAQAIHNASSRAAEPFIGVNVSALPHELLESELFGYETGAFTGASSRGSPGKFELAEGGTVLLDEIGDLPIDMQAKLLRVLQERVVQRLGGGSPRPFSCHVIASTNRELEDDVVAGRFRLDLLHRLRVVHLRLPPLRERPGDVRLLVERRLSNLAAAAQRASLQVAPQVMEALEGYAWPGNVRELMNVLDCEVSLLPPGKDVIDTVPESLARGAARLAASEPVTLEDAERVACGRALEKAQGNVASAARILGVAKATMYSKMKRYGLHPAPRR